MNRPTLVPPPLVLAAAFVIVTCGCNKKKDAAPTASVQSVAPPSPAPPPPSAALLVPPVPAPSPVPQPLHAKAGHGDGGTTAQATCTLSELYRHDTDGVGSATIRFTPTSPGHFKAVESGLGSFTGDAQLKGLFLSIDWHTNNGFSGVYSWTLDPTCKKGEGKLVFHSGGSGTHPSHLTIAK